MPACMASTSLIAYKTVNVTKLEEDVLSVIESFGASGCIFDEVQAVLSHLPNSVSGRFKSLERKGMIVRHASDTRPGKTGNPQKVIRHWKFVASAPVPVPIKAPKSPFLAGMLFAAKAIVKADPAFKGTAGAMALKSEILKVAK